MDRPKGRPRPSGLRDPTHGPAIGHSRGGDQVGQQSGTARRLRICIGIRMGWNYVQSAIYSGVVSGVVADPSLLRATIEGPAFLTGRSFRLEESLFALVYCTTAGVVLLFVAIRRGHILPQMWNR